MVEGLNKNKSGDERHCFQTKKSLEGHFGYMSNKRMLHKRNGKKRFFEDQQRLKSQWTD